MAWLRFRTSEWVLLCFFAYIVLLIPFFQDRPLLGQQPVIVLLAVLALLCCLSRAESTDFARPVSIARDWIPMVLTLVAFREMELFVPSHYNGVYEAIWARWDNLLLHQWHIKRVIEALGPVIPLYLELCYLLVYGVGTYCVIVLWLKTERRGVDRFYTILLTGTLLSYALFPYFPSEPPRLAFPHLAMPGMHNVFRKVNWFLLGKATIHSGVFPSAHVSSAFSAAWAMFLILPRRKRYGWGLLIYAVSVAVSTVYGRYHYAADALAGFGISLLAGLLGLLLRQRDRKLRRLPESA